MPENKKKTKTENQLRLVNNTAVEFNLSIIDFTSEFPLFQIQQTAELHSLQEAHFLVVTNNEHLKVCHLN
jgi:hypothetical protein